ncbi:helix-turn-helix transcriptional regulator [Lentzea sp. NPDC004782]|uniref:helix-turn-helix domain-containing protein n=1 Tax=Lentzea sp. NPDC004782 TaxID=3154458 RepID=UPI0033BA18DC
MSTPDDRRIAFANELIRIRKKAGLNGKQLAERCGWQASKVSKIENKRQDPTDSDVLDWMTAVEAPESEVERMREWLRSIDIDRASWKHQLHKGHADRQNYSRQIESSVSIIRVFEVIVVPGLVQIAEYARHIFISAAQFQQTPMDTDDAVSIRIERQRALYDSAKSIELLICESALMYYVCPPEVMVAQIDRLQALLGLRVRFGIIPLGTRLPTVPPNGFWIVGDRVLIETVDTEINTETPTDLETYNRLMDQLWTVAAEGDKARKILVRCAEAASAAAAAQVDDIPSQEEK